MKLAHALLLLSLPCLVLAKEKEPPKPEGETVTLDTFKVRDNAVSSFAISLRILYNKDHKNTRIFITYVMKNSDADRLGLHVGDEIMKINGQPVENLEPRVTPDTELGKLLLNRHPGDPLALEVMVRRAQQVTLRASVPSPVQ